MSEQDFIHLKPAEGFSLRKPDGSLLAAEGERVRREPYWLRRLNAGEAVELKAAPKSETKTEKEVRSRNHG